MEGTDGGKRKLPFFGSTTPIDHRRKSTVRWHRGLRSLLYLIAWIFILLVVIGNVSNKPVLRSTYFLYLDLSHIIPVSVPNAVLINSIAQTIGLHDFYQVGLWNFCEGYNADGITYCSDPETLFAFNPVHIILSELLAGASVALPANISEPLDLARTASHWMFGLLLAGAVLNFVMIFVGPLAVSSRHPRYIKSWAAGYDSANGSVTQAPGPPPHRRRTFVWLRALPLLILAFFTALVTIVGSAVATVMFVIFADVFQTADPSINIKAHIGTQMMVFMWIGSGFSLIAFILQFGSCCAACCRGRKARKQLKSQGINWHEKGSIQTSSSGPSEQQYPAAAQPHAVASGRDVEPVSPLEERRLSSSGYAFSNEEEQRLGSSGSGHPGHTNGNHAYSSEPHAVSR